MLHQQLRIYRVGKQKRYWCSLVRREGLPSGAQSGYVYDWIRQRQRRADEEKKRKRKVGRKIKKVTKVTRRRKGDRHKGAEQDSKGN
jgi:hypothetical protein